MLTRDELVDLYRSNRETSVLSLYLNAEEHDPAKRRAWRRNLDHLIDAVTSTVPDAEHEAFEKALAHIKSDLRQYDAFLPDAGWAGFATATGLLHAEQLPFIMPDLATWETGLHVAPYVRALRRMTPVITILVDSRQAKRYAWRNGTMVELPGVSADTFFGDLSDVNMSKRAAVHSGVRGETDTDAARRFEEVGSERLLKYLTDAVISDAGHDGIVVVGGTNEMSAALLQRLRRTLDGRIVEEPSISFWMSVPELKRATQSAAATVWARRQEQLLDQVINTAAAGGRACVGNGPTQRALMERRVDVLLVSKRFGEQDPIYADNLVGTAFEQDADVEELSGVAAERLDSAAQGVAARLRF
jgi:Bacterial archaeo-eukaryotic release factor family 10